MVRHFEPAVSLTTSPVDKAIANYLTRETCVYAGRDPRKKGNDRENRRERGKCSLVTEPTMSNLQYHPTSQVWNVLLGKIEIFSKG